MAIRILAFYLSFFALLLHAGPPVSAQSTEADPVCTELHVGGADLWYPFAYRDSETNAPLGVAYDFVQWIGHHLGLPIRIHDPVPWTRTEAQFNHGEIDLIAGVYDSKGRWDGRGILSREIAQDQVRIFVKDGKEFDFEHPTDLIGKSGAGLLGARWGSDFEAVREQLDLEEVHQHAQVLRMILKERVDYGILPLFNGRYWMGMVEGANALTVLPTPVATNAVHLVLSTKSPCAGLAADIDGAIQFAIESGKLDEILMANNATTSDASM